MGVDSRQQMTLQVRKMKLIALLFLAASTTAEWTCDDCAEASKKLAADSTSAEATAAQTALLVAGLCDQAPDPEECVEGLPQFWPPLAKIIFPEHYKHICDDMPCKDILPPQALLPNCQECKVRVNGITDYLAHDDVIEQWVTALQESEYCEHLMPDAVEKCEQALESVLTLGLPILAKFDRSWVDYWCNEFGCLP